jgi:hypothetical protein
LFLWMWIRVHTSLKQMPMVSIYLIYIRLSVYMQHVIRPDKINLD